MDNDQTYLAQKLQEGDDDTYVFLKYYVPLCSYARDMLDGKMLLKELVSDTLSTSGETGKRSKFIPL